MIREELYKWLEPEFAVLKLIDFFPWTQDLGNNYVHNFFYKIVMIYDFFSFLTVHKPSLGSFKAIKKVWLVLPFWLWIKKRDFCTRVVYIIQVFFKGAFLLSWTAQHTFGPKTSQENNNFTDPRRRRLSKTSLCTPLQYMYILDIVQCIYCSGILTVLVFWRDPN